MPEVLKTEIDSKSGEVISITRNPLTGQIDTQVIGHITPEKTAVKYVSTSQEIGKDGSKIFTGIREDGQVVREVIAPPGTFRVVGSGTGGSGGSSGTANLITLKDVQSLNLPFDLVGLNEAQLLADLKSTIPPEWFRNLAEKRQQASLTDQSLRGLWEEFKQEIQTSLKGDDISSLINDISQ